MNHHQPFSTRQGLISAFVFFTFCLTTFATAAYITSVAPKDEECFFIPAPPGGKGGTLHGNFDLLDDAVSPDPLSVVVIDYQEEHVLYRSRRRSKEGIFKVVLKPNQKVNLCLQNGIVTAGRGRKAPSERMHDGLDRTIGFVFNVEPKNEAQELKTQSDKIVQAARDLTREIKNLYNHHEYMRTREAKHREVVEQTFSQLMYWIILEGFTVILIAAGQVSCMHRRRLLDFWSAIYLF
jgi:hypothetical protein